LILLLLLLLLLLQSPDRRVGYDRYAVKTWKVQERRCWKREMSSRE
jgi:hypothetical protein